MHFNLELANSVKFAKDAVKVEIIAGWAEAS
jgi:hypothetical protein